MRSARLWALPDGLLEVLAVVSVMLAALGFLLATPRLGSADEDAHQATAWFVSNHGSTPREWQQPSEDLIPGVLVAEPCTKGMAHLDASCLPDRKSLQPMYASRIVNYPPPYYYVVAAGQRIMSVFSPEQVDQGGRIATAVLNLVMLAGVLVAVRRRTALWGTNFLLVSTPTVVFFWVMVNPSGWEVTTGLAFTVAFALAWWDGQSLAHARSGSWRLFLGMTALAVLFAFARPAAWVWLALLAAAVVATGPRLRRLDRRRSVLLIAAGLGVFSGVVWALTHPPTQPNGNSNPPTEISFVTYVNYAQQSLSFFPDRIKSFFGMLGWFDTPIHGFLLTCLLVGWVILGTQLVIRGGMPIGALVMGFLGVVVVPTVLEVMYWVSWPYWWQGRYTLPFLVPFTFVILMRYGSALGKSSMLLSALSGLSLAYMVLLNGARYAFGIREMWPLRLSDPALEPWILLTTTGCAVGIGIVTLLRLVSILSLRRTAQHTVTAPLEPTLPSRRG